MASRTLTSAQAQRKAFQCHFLQLMRTLLMKAAPRTCHTFFGRRRRSVAASLTDSFCPLPNAESSPGARGPSNSPMRLYLMSYLEHGDGLCSAYIDIQ